MLNVLKSIAYKLAKMNNNCDYFDQITGIIITYRQQRVLFENNLLDSGLD